MAVYKVIQDIEAEDKLLGPLTLKAFIYAMIAATCVFIEYKLLTISGNLKFLFMFIFFWPMALFAVLASPLGREQPTEVWLLSRIRYFLKTRKRIWDQEGMSELVTVTAPKKEELHLTKELSQTEVDSRLKALAMTLDTRGWAVKNVDVNLSPINQNIARPVSDSDRLVGPSGVPQEMTVVDVHAADDIMDEKNNPTAKKFDSLMKQSDDERKRNLLDSLKGLKPNASMALPKALLDKKKMEAKQQAELDKKLAAARTDFTKEFTGKGKQSSETPAGDSKQNPIKTRGKPVTPKDQSVKMELAQSGNAFSVATLSKLANRRPQIERTGPGEVTISLH